MAAFASDPDHATVWYQNIKAVEWETSPPLVVGSGLAFLAQFLGRRLSYTYEYEWEEAGRDRTRMRLRNRGEPSGFASVAAPVMMRAMRRANRKDLERLKEILDA